VLPFCYFLPENSLTLRRQNWRRTSVLRVSVNSQAARAGRGFVFSATYPVYNLKKCEKQQIEISPAKARKIELQFSLKKPG
jgi:hypothetical protein